MQFISISNVYSKILFVLVFYAVLCDFSLGSINKILKLEQKMMLIYYEPCKKNVNNGWKISADFLRNDANKWSFFGKVWMEFSSQPQEA